MPSNTALTVGEKIEYCLIKTYNLYTHQPINVVLAKELITKVFKTNFKEVSNQDELIFNNDKEIPYIVVETFLGKDIVGMKYHQIWDDSPLPNDSPENAFRLISGDFVTTEDGTGIVHTAPTFGADDAIAAKNAKPEVPPMLIKNKNGDLVPLVDLQGKFVKELGFLGGKFVKNEYYEEG